MYGSSRLGTNNANKLMHKAEFSCSTFVAYRFATYSNFADINQTWQA